MKTVRTILAIGALAITVGGCGDDGGGSGTAEEATGSPSPSFVEPAECREEGAALLEDAGEVLRAKSSDEISRYATFVEQDHFPSCAGVPVNELAHVVDAVTKLDEEAQVCFTQGQFMDLDGDGEGDGNGTGLDCSYVDKAFAALNREIDEAEDVLDATEGP